MLKFLTQRAKWIIIGFGVFIFGLSQTDWLRNSELWQKAEGALIDKRYVWRGEKSGDTNIVLIGLGTTAFQLDTLSSNEIAASPTLQLMQQPWPWDRKVYAAILDKLMSGGAKVVMFDFVFASETDGDDEFAKMLKKYQDRVVIGEMIQDEQGAEGNTKKFIGPNERVVGDTESIVGLVDQWTDPDDAIRRIRYRTSIMRETSESQSADINPKIAAYLKQQVAEGKIPDDLTHITLMVAEKFKGKAIATPSPGQLKFIDYQGPSGTYRPLPVENIFVDALWTNPPFDGGLAFSNKIVIVGPMAEIFHDVHTTPFGLTPGPEVQAQILAALLKQSWLKSTSWAVNFAIALGMLFIGLEICLRIRNALLKITLLVVAVFLFFIGCQYTFSYYKLVLPMMQPLFCLIVPGAAGVAFQFALEQLERLRTRSLLERYVSKNVAKTILEDQRSFIESLNGRKQSVTVLFSDIRGFTSMTENSDAAKLVAQLNEYFLEMVGVVLKENGTLQKFIGDAIMAAWGDTHSLGSTEDARRAVSAALQMRAALTKLNERWATQPDRQQLKTGIGINHGDIIVGNIGHPQRMEFTVLGDGVNLAARLESATKQFHTDILIGEETEKLTREQFIYRSVGAIAFKGKTKPVETFVVLSDRSQPAPEWLATYHGAIRMYRNRQFDLATTMFRETLGEIGGKDFLCEMYLELCATHLQNPLPQNWDASITLMEK
ncbi:MAG TPA: adenylate/guanylate cyclase domain-containing protein [Candidatus Baltobacteraceae bacterium]|nr:adenylate/guanylate cyclase domain-containing protein [Candidatus Baltobacteraceae bacterium]